MLKKYIFYKGKSNFSFLGSLILRTEKMATNSFELYATLNRPCQIVDNGLGDDQAIQNKLNPRVDRC